MQMLAAKSLELALRHARALAARWLADFKLCYSTAVEATNGVAR